MRQTVNKSTQTPGAEKHKPRQQKVRKPQELKNISHDNKSTQARGSQRTRDPETAN